jgi:hypothetical protein
VTNIWADAESDAGAPEWTHGHALVEMNVDQVFVGKADAPSISMGCWSSKSVSKACLGRSERMKSVFLGEAMKLTF